MNKIFYFLIICLSIVSCGKDSGVTHLSFTKSFAAAGDTLQGGIMVYAVKDGALGYRGSEFFDGESNEVSDGNLRTLENGDWFFYAFGIVDDTAIGSGGPLTASNNYYCGVANGGNAVTLTGGQQTIDIQFSLSNCASNPIFADTDYIHSSSGRTKDVDIIMCSGANWAANIDTQEFATALNSSQCPATPASFTGKVFVYGFVELPLLNYLTFSAEELESQIDFNAMLNGSLIGCHDLDADGKVLSLTEVPFGNVSGDNFFRSPFAFAYILLDAADCNSIQGANQLDTFILPRGFVDAEEGGSAESYDDAGWMYTDSGNANKKLYYYDTGLN